MIESRSPTVGAHELIVEIPEAAASVEPGQFFQIAVGAQGALLRRPYSAAWSDRASGRLGFIFNVVGKGSEWLSRRRAGDVLDLLGPLGHGFDLGGSSDAICVAGGLGAAVFPGVVQALVQRGRRVSMLLGARTAAQLLPADRFGGARVGLATDDGSAGHRGSVVDIFDPSPTADVFACGPTPMLQALVARAQRRDLPLASVQVALETPMGCGLGTCLGCVAPNAAGGYLLTCKDGPCVRADRLDWSRMTDAFHG